MLCKASGGVEIVRQCGIVFLFLIASLVLTVPALASDGTWGPNTYIVDGAPGFPDQGTGSGLESIVTVGFKRTPGDTGIAPSSSTASINIVQVPAGKQDYVGKTCLAMPGEVLNAMNQAARNWENTIQSSVGISVRACWTDLAGDTHGYSGGWEYHKNFINAPIKNAWYTGSLANALAGHDLTPGQHDMHITMNRGMNWYFGQDASPPQDQYDFVTAVMRKIGHGLNFSGTMRMDRGEGRYGYGDLLPGVYDSFIVDRNGKKLTDTGVYKNPSTALGTALTSDNLWWNGAHGKTANGGRQVKIYAPASWTAGKSYQHLDFDTFRETGNRLMISRLPKGDAIHDPGPVTRGILRDMGWKVRGLPQTTLSKVTNLWDVPDARAGQPSVMWAEVENVSSFSLPARTKVWFYVRGPGWEDNWVGSASLKGLEAGVTEWFKIEWDIPSSALPGTYTYWARAYIGNEAASDWSTAKSFEVQPSTTPSANITELWPVLGAIAGKNAYLQSEVYNTSSLPLPDDAWVYYYVTGPGFTDNWVGRDSVAGLVQGESRWYGYSWSIPSNAAEGKYTYWARVYKGSAATGIPISNWSSAEEFHVRSVETEIKGEVYSLWTVEGARAGRSSDFYMTVKNTGDTVFPDDARLYMYVQGAGARFGYTGYTSVAGLQPQTIKSYKINWLIPYDSSGGSYTFWGRLYQGNTALSDWSSARRFNVQASQETRVFEERFTSSPNNWLQDSGEWRIAGDRFWYTRGREGFATISTFNQNHADVNFATRMWREGNNSNANSILVRASGNIMANGYLSSAYVFQYNRAGYFRVFKYVNGVYSNMQAWAPADAIKPGSDWNEMRAVAVGANLWLYINDTLVWSGRDRSLNQGRVGVGMFTENSFANNGLWVDWATLGIPVSGYSAEQRVSKEQQRLNNEANEIYSLNAGE